MKITPTTPESFDGKKTLFQLFDEQMTTMRTILGIPKIHKGFMLPITTTAAIDREVRHSYTNKYSEAEKLRKI